MKNHYLISVIFLFLLGCNFDNERTVVLVDSSDRASVKLYIKNNQVIKGDFLDTFGERQGLIRFELDTVVFEEEWDNEGNTIRKYSDQVLNLGLSVGKKYIESNYSSVSKFELVKIDDQTQFYRPTKFNYDSSEFFDRETEQLLFKTIDLNYDEPILSRIIRYQNGEVQSVDTVTGKFLNKLRQKLVKDTI